MSTTVFPALAGLGWSLARSEMWKTRTQAAISGKETRLADWSYPRHQWTVAYDFLRQGMLSGSAYAEFAALAGFFNARQGAFDTFLYTDPDDCAVTAQGLGTGDGATTTFQLVRGFGGYAEPIFAPNAVGAVYVNGVAATPGTDYGVSTWEQPGVGGAYGIVTFAGAPAPGAAITADFTYYFPCRFAADQLDFEKFMAALYEAKKVSFISLK